MSLVHLDNVANFSISFLMSQLNTEATEIPCSHCGNKLVFVSVHSQSRIDLAPRLSHFRCLCCAATFIEPTQFYDFLPNFNKHGGNDLYMSKPSSMQKIHNPNINIPR